MISRLPSPAGLQAPVHSKAAEQANGTPSGPKGAGNDNNTLESKMLAAIMQVMEEHQGNESKWPG